MATTGTTTYTRTDVRKVFENFAADLSMLVRRTGTMNLDWAQDMAHDVVLMAEYKCLESVHVQLFDSLGHLEKAHEYTVRANDVLREQRPGGNDWPATPGGHLAVIVKYSNVQVAEHLKSLNNTLKIKWVDSRHSVDYSRMLPDGNREYSSNAYGLSRNSFSIR